MGYQRVIHTYSLIQNRAKLKMLEALTFDHTLSFLLPLSLSLSSEASIGGPGQPNSPLCGLPHTLSLPPLACRHLWTSNKAITAPPWWLADAECEEACEREREREREKICIAYVLVHTNILPIASKKNTASFPS